MPCLSKRSEVSPVGPPPLVTQQDGIDATIHLRQTQSLSNEKEKIHTGHISAACQLWKLRETFHITFCETKRSRANIQVFTKVFTATDGRIVITYTGGLGRP